MRGWRSESTFGWHVPAFPALENAISSEEAKPDRVRSASSSRSHLHGLPSLNTATQNAFQKRPKLLLFIGYGLATICLVWVLHDFHIVQELKNLANVSWEWVLIGMGCDVLSYVIQSLRWKFLLAPFGKVRL